MKKQFFIWLNAYERFEQPSHFLYFDNVDDMRRAVDEIRLRKWKRQMRHVFGLLFGETNGPDYGHVSF